MTRTNLSRIPRGSTTAEVTVADSSREDFLVTGMHRSGTTWVGRGLATATKSRYVHEPSNPDVNRRLSEYYVAASSDRDLYSIYGFALARGLRTRIESAVHADVIALPKRLHTAACPMPSVVKDPFAIFSAARLRQIFGVSLVLCTRHPAGVVSSMCRLGWGYNLAELAQQTTLMSQLSDIDPGLSAAVVRGGDIVEGGAVLWTVLHKWWRHYMDEPYARAQHEILTLNPSSFDALVPDALLDRSALHEYVRRTRSGAGKADAEKWNDVVRDPERLDRPWRRRLSADEVDRIRRVAEDEGSYWGYDLDSW